MKPLASLTSVLIIVSSIYAQSSPDSPTATAASTAAEDIPSSLGITPCILACVIPAAKDNGCSGFTDIACVCSSAKFQADAAACLQAHCSKTEIDAALTLQEVQCGAVSISATGAASSTRTVDFTTPSVSAGESTASSTSTSTAPAQPSETFGNGAMVPIVGWAGVVAVVAAIVAA